MIKVTVWSEFVHEKSSPVVREIYPEGMHAAIAEGLNEDGGLEARTATLDEPEHGLTEEILEATDVLTWWGHTAHEKVSNEIVDRVQKRVLEGMGLIVLHSGHYSKIFRRLMGTTCSLCWREAGEKERVWVVISKSNIRKCMESRSEFLRRTNRFSSVGLPAARYSDRDKPGNVEMERSSTSAPATKPIRSTTTKP